MLERGRAMENLKRARKVPRCVHIKQDGTQCGSPSLKNDGLCFAHARLAMRHAKLLAMPLLEDANSVQAAIMEVMRGLLDGDIDRKTAGLLLYGLQMAACNLKHVCFEPKDRKSVLRDISSIQPYCDLENDCENNDCQDSDCESKDGADQQSEALLRLLFPTRRQRICHRTAGRCSRKRRLNWTHLKCSRTESRIRT
jgi:hypothetical protein